MKKLITAATVAIFAIALSPPPASAGLGSIIAQVRFCKPGHRCIMQKRHAAHYSHAVVIQREMLADQARRCGKRGVWKQKPNIHHRKPGSKKRTVHVWTLCH